MKAGSCAAAMRGVRPPDRQLWPGYPPVSLLAAACVGAPAGPTLNDMGKLALLAFAVLLPTLAGGAILAVVRVYRRLGALRRNRPSQG